MSSHYFGRERSGASLAGVAWGAHQNCWWLLMAELLILNVMGWSYVPYCSNRVRAIPVHSRPGGTEQGGLPGTKCPLEWLTQVSTPLVLAEWKKLLGQHPDSKYIWRVLLTGLQLGFRIGYTYHSHANESAKANMTLG